VKRALAALIGAALFATGCGYHVAGHTNLIPKNVKTIAVPAFANATTRYKLADQLHRAVTREFIERTRYKIVADPEKADAVLEASLVNYVAYPTVFDQATGRASGVQTNVTLAVTLRERATGKVIFQRPYWDVKERYEIATDPRAYFDESDTAAERLSRDVARTVVSSVLSSF
jgi:outer membrane lipopolysaccharide assembly protein LptE/RlpB